MNSKDILTYSTNNLGIWNWIACHKDYKAGDKIGYGLTKRYAILSLVEQMVDGGAVGYDHEKFKKIVQEGSSCT